MWVEYIQGEPSTHPTVGARVIYFFSVVGVHRGQYHGDWCFSSNSGFLEGDVTHWMPDDGRDLVGLAKKNADFHWVLP